MRKGSRNIKVAHSRQEDKTENRVRENFNRKRRKRNEY